nr:hypothetical protein BaRGS_032253 [Batillaria attramentaria]
MSVIPGGSVVLKANIRLTGNPPDLTLTIQLDNIQEEEDGEWTLYIANDKGDGQVDFKINIADTSVTLLVAIASGVAALAAVIGFIVVAALMARRFSNGKKGSRSSYRVVLQAKRQIGTDEPRPHSPSPSREVHIERNPPERTVPGACGRVIPDGTDAPDNGEYAEITAGGVSRGVFVGGPMECYTDVVDQLVGAQAPQPDVSSHNYYYVAPDEILDRKQKARK